jgi:hypothetical protein
VIRVFERDIRTMPGNMFHQRGLAGLAVSATTGNAVR